MTNTGIQDPDQRLLREETGNRTTRLSRKAADWDKKAASFAERTAHSIYTEKFLALLKPRPEWSILDIGCGPGTLAIPLAACSRKVTALDFSGNMLAILRQRALRKKLKNITTCQVSWQDNWQQHGIKPHDVAIASRSLAVPDLKTALMRLNNYGTRKICVTDRVGPGPKDPDAFAAIGRELPSGPDYIHTLNLLCQMGYLPAVSYIRLEQTMSYASFKDALDSYLWMFLDLNNKERQLLNSYVASIVRHHVDGTVTVQRKHIPTWAFISWNPEERNQ